MSVTSASATSPPSSPHLHKSAAPRANPRYLMFSTKTHFAILNDKETADTYRVMMSTNSSEKKEVAIRGHNAVSVDMQPLPESEPYGVHRTNTTKNLTEYTPTFFYCDDKQTWAPLSPAMCISMNKALANSQDETRDKERTYDLVNKNQVNRESGRKRPLLHLRPDGSAVRGECIAFWAYAAVARSVQTNVAVPFNVAEQLEQAYTSGKKDAFVKFKPVGFEKEQNDVEMQVTFDNQRGGNNHTGKEISSNSMYEQEWEFVRYHPSWFFLNDERRWAPLPYDTTMLLDRASASGLDEVRDRERVYDLRTLMQRNTESGRARLLCHVRGKTGSGLSSTPATQQLNPDVFRRLLLVMDPKITEATIKSRLADPNTDLVSKVLLLCNGLVHQHNFVVKGGILRDAVKNDMSQSKDIDVELPASWIQDQTCEDLPQKCDAFYNKIKAQYGLDRPSDPSRKVTSRTSFDIFGPGCGRTAIANGIITVPVQLPPTVVDSKVSTTPTTPILDLEMVPAWNSAYNPPRNCDMTINNLRVSATSTDLQQNVPLCLPGSNQQISVTQILQQIELGQTSPCYDFKWVEGTTGKTGEGATGTKWCVACNEANSSREELMQERIDKMRAKGFKFMETPPL